MPNLTGRDLKRLFAQWTPESVTALRDGQIIDLETGELTGAEWLTATLTSRTGRTITSVYDTARGRMVESIQDDE